MRLSGVAFKSSRLQVVDPASDFNYKPELVGAPLNTGYIPLDQYTGIIGRNDTGKTRLLRIIEDALRGYRDPDLTLPGTVLFFSCSEAEFEALTQQATLDLTEFDDEQRTLEERPLEADRRLLWDRRPSLNVSALEDATLTRERPVVEQYAEILKESWTRNPEAFSRIVEVATTPSHDSQFPATLTVALRRISNSWGVYWCVPPIIRCSEALVEDLKACLIGPEINRREASEGDRFWRKVIHETITFGWPREAPTPIAPVGLVPLPLSPRSLRAADLDSVTRRVENVFGEFLIRTKRLEALIELDFDSLDEENDIPGYGVSPSATREALTQAWFSPTKAGGFELNRDVLGLARQLEAWANDLLPSFIRQDYRLVVNVSSPARWSRGPQLELGLFKETGTPAEQEMDAVGEQATEGPARRFGIEFSTGHRFPVSQVAQGFKLWIGIAITEAASLFDIVAESLEVSIADMLIGIMYGGDEEEESRERAEADLQSAREISLSVDEATGGAPLHRPLDEYLDWERINVSVRANTERNRGLVYLLDEPERHLHPALQREAAEWLKGRLASSGFQAVVATHSLPFMSVSGDASFTYLVREPEAPTALVPINPRELDSLSLAATELGIDRGELLSLVNLFLWVEGYSEQVILETLFGPELRDLGVYVIPLHGHPGARGIIDSRIHSFTSAGAAVWLDAISPEFVAEAEVNPEVETSTPEEKTLVEVIRSAQSGGTSVVPISVDAPGDDVFDLLDDLAIESEFPEYPGHEEARRLWLEAREKGAKARSRKDFWAQKFKTPVTPDSCRRIASRMRREGRITPQLASVLEQCKAIVIS